MITVILIIIITMIKTRLANHVSNPEAGPRAHQLPFTKHKIYKGHSHHNPPDHYDDDHHPKGNHHHDDHHIECKRSLTLLCRHQCSTRFQCSTIFNVSMFHESQFEANSLHQFHNGRHTHRHCPQNLQENISHRVVQYIRLTFIRLT